MHTIFSLARAVIYIAILLASVGVLLKVLGYLKRKFSKARDTSAITDLFESSGEVLVAVLLVVCAVFLLWIERFKFDHVTLDNGESYPVRVNRLTGNSQVLYRGVWRASSDLPKLPSLIQDFGPQDLEKLKGDGRIDPDAAYFDLPLYNGSDVTLKEITVEIIIRDSTGKDVLRRAYRIEQQHPPKQTRDYFQELGFHLGPSQSWAWKIVAAKGFTP